ncbi:MAG: type IX secretion system membrane protein PorP/SprF [Bacteroidetes bacterium]|nr:type IX secretion system membrane protein PorP/SprF [Bacteroidota bacterium]
MNFKAIVSLIIALAGLQIEAQQDPQVTQYMYNMNIVNPAYAGSTEAISLGLLGRTQWVGLDGAPKTVTFSIHSPVGKNIGLGMSVVSDQIGPVNESNLNADFSYTLKTSDIGKLALGLKAGVTFQDLGLATITTVSPDVNFTDNINNTFPNFGVGAFYYTDKFYAGIAMPNMIKSNHFEKQGGIISKATEKMHYFINSGYVFDITENLKFKPSVLLKAVTGSPVSMDLSSNFLINERLELGASYRIDDSFSGLVNFAVNQNLRIGYAYDYTISNLGDYNSGSHEVIVRYDFHFYKYKSPRFF